MPQTTYQAADRDINHHALISVSRCDPDNNTNAPNNHNSSITQKPRRYHKTLHILDPIDGSLRRRVDDDNHGADQAHETAYLAHKG
jgi:hypothetical protein